MVVLVSISACVKRPLPAVTQPTETGSLNFSIDHVAGGEELELHNKWYLTPNGDSLKLTTFNYYLSNFVLTDVNGNEYKQPESYYLIREDKPATKKFTIPGVPVGKYKKLRFLIGVDSARNVSGAQTGALDQSNGMFWDWNTGYIMAMIEGVSPQSNMFNNLVIFHLGGFRKADNVTRVVELTLPETIEVTASNNHSVHIKGDVMEWFKTPHLIDIKVLTAAVVSGNVPTVLADNYTDMFTIDHVD